ncbi:hypothetical protein G5T42_14885 [Microbacterium sp. 4R-513]|uniref:hypothetical protein n=1 Tax=Microbacterium sp. 4R-513 TaxID=2567934 RepID=UPI0013E1F281|nr:hypothetical protein [Microbacterium sp. 4R-513]QIG40604.1 hypothetical protein G5T42_14885 [Microbacterium sp. 4R-513]
MNRLRRAVAAAGLAAASLVLLAACATPAAGGGAPFGTVPPAAPDGEVRGTGTVLDRGGDVQLCLGPIAESYPPQCSGIPLQGWSWDGVEGSDSSGDAHWGAYAVQGTYDGETLTVTGPPILLALYDPIRPEDPTGGKPGTADEATLEKVRAELPSALGDQFVSSSIERGYVWVDVIWDDGTLQDAADAAYGDGVVVVRSALQG